MYGPTEVRGHSTYQPSARSTSLYSTPLTNFGLSIARFYIPLPRKSNSLIVQVPAYMAQAKWPDLAPFFAKVTRHTNGCYEPDDVLADILKGEQLLWVAWDQATNTLDAVMTTRLVDYPRRKICQVIFIAGAQMGRWLSEFQETVEQYAREHGATGLEGHLRRGWVRVWNGCRERGVSLFKDLTV